ncbi:MAG: OmpA family protein [Flavobacteriaceae bacterium]
MKNLKISLVALAVLTGSVFTGCDAVQNASNEQKGVAIGAASGAVIGGILGNNLGKGGNTALGAIIGGAVGGVAGGVIGNKMDKQAQKIEEALPGADVVRVDEGIQLVLGESSVNFEISKATLTSTAKANLDKLIPVFTEYAETDIKIYGYTDSTGSVDFNQKLSEQRAASVKDYLVSKGLKASRFVTKGMGIADPIADNTTVEGRSKNRRVEFAITANETMKQQAEKEAQQQ